MLKYHILASLCEKQLKQLSKFTKYLRAKMDLKYQFYFINGRKKASSLGGRPVSFLLSTSGAA
jgi:hypothetical protein